MGQGNPGKGGEKISFVLEEKIDGTAIELVYEKGAVKRAATRGNGRTGYDVTDSAAPSGRFRSG